MAKTTWRFEFVDINKSIVINEAEATWTGFAVIRAPKGTTQAMYVPPKNRQMIETMFGYASADWPDIFEVIDFNQQYGVYISAPTVDVAEFPNYFGGVYFTKYGLLEMYRCTDKKNPNFEIGLKVGAEPVSLPGVDASTFTLAKLNNPGEQALITITGIDADVYKKLKYIDFSWTGNVPFRYKLDKVNGWLLPDSSSVSDAAAQKIVCGSFQLNADTRKYDFVIGGTKADQHGNTFTSSMNTVNDERTYGIPYIDFSGRTFKADSVYDYSQYMTVGDTTYDTVDEWVEGDDSGLPAAILDAIVNGGTVLTAEGNKLKYEKPISESFKLVYDVSGDVYSYHVQPSQTAAETKISVGNIVYDRYNYTRKLYYTSKVYTSLPTPETSAKAFAKTFTEDGYLALAYTDKNNDGETTNEALRIYAYLEEEDDETEEVTASWVDVTGEYATDSVLAFDTLDARPNNDIHHKIFRVGESSLTEMTLDATDEDYVLTENVLYNSYFSKAVEKDSEGEIHTSGAFTGSLDEFGTDENGTDNYWEELIPPGDSVVYAEPYVVRTFDEDLDDRGIYTGFRIDGDATISVSGQRYVDYVVEKNIKDGKTGGDVTTAKPAIQKKFAKIVKEGLIEAAKPKYEDCSVFFECTGLEAVKTYISAIRTAHYTATIVTPKNLTSIENCKKYTVTGRCRGTAQYAQELLYKDKNLRKKYYACPIGAVAAMLMKIMEEALGGVAPMWINEGSLGGQITDLLQRSPIKPRWDFTDPDTKIFDEKGINPITMDEDDGVMITSQRTTEQNAGDWSSLGHSMSFDLCKREIRDNVMKPQIGKKISPHWISKRQMQVDRILGKRTGGDDPIWAYAHSDIASANNDYTRAQKIFNIPVEVRVWPFSEKVRLSFTNLSQITTVSD